jgi:hypothetical protein
MVLVEEILRPERGGAGDGLEPATTCLEGSTPDFLAASLEAIISASLSSMLSGREASSRSASVSSLLVIVFSPSGTTATNIRGALIGINSVPCSADSKATAPVLSQVDLRSSTCRTPNLDTRMTVHQPGVC